MTVLEATGPRVAPRLFAMTVRVREARVKGFLDEEDFLTACNHPLQEWVNRWCQRRGLRAGYIKHWLSEPITARNADPLLDTPEARTEYPDLFRWRVMVRWLAVPIESDVDPATLAGMFPNDAGATLALGFVAYPTFVEIP